MKKKYTQNKFNLPRYDKLTYVYIGIIHRSTNPLHPPYYINLCRAVSKRGERNSIRKL